MSGGGLSTSRLRVEYAPACQAKGNLYLEAYRALDTVFKHFGYAPRRVDTGAYNCRRITGGSGYSLHAYGPGDSFTFWNGLTIKTSLAVDVNWQSGPYGPRPQPTDRPKGMNAAIRAIRTNSGEQLWRNGADYTGANVDPMHSEIVCTKRGLQGGVNWSTVIGHGAEPPSTGDTFMAALTEAEQREILEGIRQLRKDVDGLELRVQAIQNETTDGANPSKGGVSKRLLRSASEVEATVGRIEKAVTGKG